MRCTGRSPRNPRSVTEYDASTKDMRQRNKVPVSTAGQTQPHFFAASVKIPADSSKATAVILAGA